MYVCWLTSLSAGLHMEDGSVPRIDQCYRIIDSEDYVCCVHSTVRQESAPVYNCLDFHAKRPIYLNRRLVIS